MPTLLSIPNGLQSRSWKIGTVLVTVWWQCTKMQQRKSCHCHKTVRNLQNTLELKTEEWVSGWNRRSWKIKSLVRYLVENSTKSLCQLQDSDNFCLLDFLCFCSFCANFSDNLVTLESFDPTRIWLSHAHISRYRLLLTTSLNLAMCPGKKPCSGIK